jgi:adenylyltransferase/sulfurtransferase
MRLSDTELTRYNRHILLPEIGADGQARLKAARVLVVGAGGLGCPAALYLAAAGVGTLCIADGDRVELSNLHRQILFQTSDIGVLKADAAAARLRALNPDICVESIAQRLDAANVLAIVRRFDIVVDGSDRLATRYLTNDACVILGKAWVSAAIHRFDGQAMVCVPGSGPCYRCLFPTASDDIVPNCAEAGVLGVLPALLGSIQATETVKLILNLGASLVGRFLTYDALAMQFREYTYKRRIDCAVCGDHPTVLTPTDPAPSEHHWPGLRRFSARELAQTLAGSHAEPAPWVVVDVREPREFVAGHLPGAINVPLGRLDAQFAHLPQSSQSVFVCRSGARSLRACAIAARHGSTHFGHLEGGLLAWAADIDSTLQVIA